MLAKSTVWNGSELGCANTPVACGMVTAAVEMAPSWGVVVQAVSSAPSAAPASRRWNMRVSPVAIADAVSLVTALRKHTEASIAQAEHGHRFVEGAGMAEMAFIEDEIARLPRPGAQVSEPGKPGPDRPGRAVEPGEGDVRREAPCLAPEPRGLAGTLDLLPQSFERVARRHARPERGRLPLAGEVADAFDPQREARPGDPRQRRGEVVRRRPLDF